MFIRRIADLPEFVAGDNTRLREVFNPLKDRLDLRYSFAVATVAPGETTFRHRLKHSEVYHLLEGEGDMYVDDECERVRAGDVIYIPPGAVQRIANTGGHDIVFVCIVDPAWKPEDEEILE